MEVYKQHEQHSAALTKQYQQHKEELQTQHIQHNREISSLKKEISELKEHMESIETNTAHEVLKGLNNSFMTKDDLKMKHKETQEQLKSITALLTNLV